MTGHTCVSEMVGRVECFCLYCTRLHIIVYGCTQSYMVCTQSYMVVHCCTQLYIVVHGCT